METVLKVVRAMVVRCFLLVLMGSASLAGPFSYAQSSSEAGPVDARESVGTILLAGLVGGILGLSTLSFYEAPEDHIRNISFGAGVGIIVAALYMTVDVASKPLPQKSSIQDSQPLSVFPLVDWDPRGMESLGLAVNYRF